MNIVVFDSGIGGTSVLQHLQHYLPFAHFSYFMDNLYMPYGSLTLPILHERLVFLLDTAISRLQSIDLIVLACNTASTQGLELLRKHTNIPIIGVVPAIKPACLLSQKHVGLLATPATVKSHYTQNLIEHNALGRLVHLYGSTTLVHLAEEKFWQGFVSAEAVKVELNRLNLHQDIDYLVLGCTHFPILKEEIKLALGASTQLIDSGEAIAKRAKALTSQVKIKENFDLSMPTTAYFSTARLENKRGLIVECLID